MRRLLLYLLGLGAALGPLAVLALYAAAPHSPAPAPPLLLPSQPPPAAVVEICRAMYPTQPDLEQACLRRWTTGEPMPGLLASPPPQPAQPDVQDFIRAATVLCGEQLGLLSSRAVSNTDIPLLNACVRAYLALEGIHLPR
jgi:hypothetical protein